jgi:hypothetical protein
MESNINVDAPFVTFPATMAHERVILIRAQASAMADSITF